jgi:hypothetical protein
MVTESLKHCIVFRRPSGARRYGARLKGTDRGQQDSQPDPQALGEEIDEGRSPNVAARAIAKHYWRLPDAATLRDVVLVVRADEAHHRDVNHGFASTLAGLPSTMSPRPIRPMPTIFE